MTGFVLSPRARSDIGDRWSTAQAERYIHALHEAIETIAGDPQRGRSCEHIRAGYRKYAVGSHVIFYRTSTIGIDVVRVLHQRMDFERHL